ncbi:MAG: PspC domain-containing protein [Gammaproteobacteria bacterium]
MNTREHFERTLRHRRFYRNDEAGLAMGVCAGVADFLGIDVWLVRIVTVLAAIFFTLPTVIIYFGLGIMAHHKPLSYRGASAERAFWQHGRHTRREQEVNQ